MFKNLKRFEIKGTTSWIDIPELGARARILVKPAGEANPPYYNAMVRLSSQRIRKIMRTDAVTAEDSAANREDDRKLFPKHVIVDWEYVEADVPDDAPEEEKYVPYSKDNAALLCRELPNHVFDGVRNKAATPERFYQDEDEPIPDSEVLAGNSPGG